MSTGRLLCVLLLSAFLVHSDVPAISAPTIDLKERVFDFKEMMAGQTVEHVFKVENRGDEPLRIEKVKPG